MNNSMISNYLVNSTEDLGLIFPKLGGFECLLLQLDLVDLPLVNQLFNRPTRNETGYLYISLLADSKRSILSLLVVTRIPVYIENNDLVCCIYETCSC
jgi:hypothetical protein